MLLTIYAENGIKRIKIGGMKKLNRYIIRQIFVGFLLVTFSLMSIIWLTQSLRFVELITNKGIPMSIFVQLTSLLMPRIFTILAPIAVFAAVLFVYNRMLSDRELIVMKSAGISPLQCAVPAIVFGLLMSFFNIFVYNYGIPWSEKQFAELQWKVKNDVSHLMLREGEFTTLQNGLTVFITTHEKDGSITGIMVNDERNLASKVTLSAEKGRVIYTDKGPKIIMVNGARQEINKKSQQFTSVSFARYSVDFGIQESHRKKEAGVRERSLEELLSARNNPNLDKKEANRFFVEGNRRLLNPFFNLLFAVLACTGLLCGNFNRRGQTKIISISVTLMIVILALDLSLTNIAVNNISLLSLIYANLLLPLFACIYLLLYYNPTMFSRKKHVPEEVLSHD